MANFDNGSYLRAQIALLDAIAARRRLPGMSIVTLGYRPCSASSFRPAFTWFSPFTWTAVSQQRGEHVDKLVSALNTANEEATSIAGAGHPALRFLYANLSAALHGLGSFSLPQGQRHNSTAASTRGSQAITMEQTIIGNDLLPLRQPGGETTSSPPGICRPPRAFRRSRRPPGGGCRPW